MKNIKNKIIIVTGASAGIGLATARLLAKHGAKVALTARSADKLAALEKELPGSFAIAADMSKPAEIKKMIDMVQKHYGRIDILVNNAGQGLYAALEEISVDDYRKIFEVNVIGPLVAMQKVIPIMRAQTKKPGDIGGMIINISSLVSKNYFPYLSAYASTKYALNALSLTARVELKKDGIIVGVVHPGMTATDFGKNAIKTSSTEGMAGRRRPGMPEPDSAETVAEKILEAIETGEAEVSLSPRTVQ